MPIYKAFAANQFGDAVAEVLHVPNFSSGDPELSTYLTNFHYCHVASCWILIHIRNSWTNCRSKTFTETLLTNGLFRLFEI